MLAFCMFLCYLFHLGFCVSLCIIRNFALFASSYLFEIIFTAPCSFSIPLNSFPSFIIFYPFNSGRQLFLFLLSRSPFVYSHSHFFLFIPREWRFDSFTFIYFFWSDSAPFFSCMLSIYISQWVLVYASMFDVRSGFFFFSPFPLLFARLQCNAARSEYIQENIPGIANKFWCNWYEWFKKTDPINFIINRFAFWSFYRWSHFTNIVNLFPCDAINEIGIPFLDLMVKNLQTFHSFFFINGWFWCI